MAHEEWSTAAMFRYIDARGTKYLVRGEPGTVGSPRAIGVIVWQGFLVHVRPEEEQPISVTKCFILDLEFVEDMAGQPDPSDADVRLKWLRALRRYALNSTLAALDAGTLTGGDHIVTPEMGQELPQWLPRRCEFMVPQMSGTLCGVNAGDDAATTQSICDACGLPDKWERCARVTNRRTHPVRTAEEGIIARECTAQCDAGKQPSENGGVPQRCRFGQLTPPCFEPNLWQAEREIKRGHMGLRPPDEQ